MQNWSFLHSSNRVLKGGGGWSCFHFPFDYKLIPLYTVLAAVLLKSLDIKSKSQSMKAPFSQKKIGDSQFTTSGPSWKWVSFQEWEGQQNQAMCSLSNPLLRFTKVKIASVFWIQIVISKLKTAKHLWIIWRERKVAANIQLKLKQRKHKLKIIISKKKPVCTIRSMFLDRALSRIVFLNNHAQVDPLKY